MKRGARNAAAAISALNVLAIIAFGWVLALTGDTWIVEDVGAFMLVTMESAVAFGGLALTMSVGLDE